MFLLRVELAGPPLFQVIRPLECLELLLHDCCGFHGGEDGSDPAVDFQGRGLVAGCLADDHLLDGLPYDVDERLLRFRVGVLAHVIEGGVDDQLDCLRADFRLQLLDLLLEILLGRCLPQPRFKAGATFFEFVEHVIEGGKTRPVHGGPALGCLPSMNLYAGGHGMDVGRCGRLASGCRRQFAGPDGRMTSPAVASH
ncbi:hypothetical protein ACCC98_32160 [Rhizobium pisi]|uniref:hypothetical protein n=1 Tax=Rhizobium pisi TaxID=574561 RepID=UPI0039B0BE61